MFRIKLLVILAVAVTLAVGASAMNANAATFTVNTLGDSTDASPFDGACADGAGLCSLRAAVMQANASPGYDAINLPTHWGGYHAPVCPGGVPTWSLQTYTLSLGALDITDTTGRVAIFGALNGALEAPRIDGNNIDRVFHVYPQATLTLSGIVVQNGNSGTAGGGGILNQGSTLLDHTTVTCNKAARFGGGIDNLNGSGQHAYLTLRDSTVNANRTTDPLGTSGGGGGIVSDSVMTLDRSTVDNNTTYGRGGGIYAAQDPASVPPFTIRNSTISTNTARNGGGIFNRYGGGSINQDTIAFNTATDTGGGVGNYAGALSAAGTVISENKAYHNTPSWAWEDCAGGISTSGNINLSGDNSCGFTFYNQEGAPVALLPLGNNGGPTRTHALGPGSTALNKIACPSGGIDQRYSPRPSASNPLCDIGAFEL